jgi:rod shape-determining protein MreD
MMNAFLKWAGWFLLCVVLQSTLVPHAAVMGVRPDLLLLVLFFLSVRAGMMTGAFAGFFLGLGQDLFAADLLGQNALAKSVTGFVCGIFNERVMSLNPIMRALLLLQAFIINDIIVMLVHIVKTDSEPGVLVTELLVVTLPRAVYTLIVSLIPFVWVNIIKPPRMVD